MLQQPHIDGHQYQLGYSHQVWRCLPASKLYWCDGSANVLWVPYRFLCGPSPTPCRQASRLSLAPKIYGWQWNGSVLVFPSSKRNVHLVKWAYAHSLWKMPSRYCPGEWGAAQIFQCSTALSRNDLLFILVLIKAFILNLAWEVKKITARLPGSTVDKFLSKWPNILFHDHLILQNISINIDNN